MFFSCNVYLLFDRFNKREEDFKTLDEFNDYLEEREDISMLCCAFQITCF